VRLGVIGGAGGSLVAPGGPRVVDVDFPDAFKAEALEMIGVLEDLQAEQTGRDWFFVHPAGGFGGFNPASGRAYRVGGDVIVTDAEGSPTSPAPISRWRCSTRSRSRSTRASASRSGTDPDADSDEVAPVDVLVFVVVDRRDRRRDHRNRHRLGRRAHHVASSRRWRSTSSM
jgi:hypothetical protein